VFENITFQTVSGNNAKQHIRLLALSTCGFCRRGQEFLENHSLAYEYVHLDTFDPEIKAKVKQEFKEKFGVTLSYPALIVDEDKYTVGYVKRHWEEVLEIPHENETIEAEALD
jgi:glutaredoxin